jgi:tRNA (cmo5U34)-methyltransferase
MQAKTKDTDMMGLARGEDWSFKREQIAHDFDKHVREQLPWYDIMSGAAAHIARHYIPQNGTVLDLGCSTGNTGLLLEDCVNARGVHYIPVDNSQQMIDIYRGPGTPILQDFSDADWVIPEYDVAILFLAMMFTAPHIRRSFIKRLLDSRRDGGCIIVVDKAESFGGYIGTIMARLTLAGKLATGTSEVDIVTKELSLIGIQRPLDIKQFPNPVEVFRFGEFAGWVIE